MPRKVGTLNAIYYFWMELTEILHNYKPLIRDAVIEFYSAPKINEYEAYKELAELKEAFVYLATMYGTPYRRAKRLADMIDIDIQKALRL